MTFEDSKYQRDRLEKFSSLTFHKASLQSFRDNWINREDDERLPVGYEHPMGHLRWGSVRTFILVEVAKEIAELEKQIEAL